MLRVYLALVPVVALVVFITAAFDSTWRAGDVGKYFLLLLCGLISVAATPRNAYQNGVVRDFLTVWVLPVAILLPPVYAMFAPIPLLLLTQWYVHRGIVYRRVFTAGAIGLSYGAVSMVFRAVPASVAGAHVGSGVHALTWTLVVTGCEFFGWLSHHLLIVTGIKLTDPSARLTEIVFSREALHADFAQIDLGVLITLVVAINPVLAIFAVPTVLLVRRFLVHESLVKQSRIDAKTGLLNVTTWEREAESEVSRALRTRSPLSIALLDIDHFKSVNDTHGHLVGDRVLRAVTDSLNSQLRDYDRAGRFGGEEFVVLLPQTALLDAQGIAERLRRHIASLTVPVSDREGAETVSLTVSVGVAAMDGVSGELTDLLAAADAALYYAKESGRNRTHVFTALLNGSSPSPRAHLGTPATPVTPVTPVTPKATRAN
jgi:diguanylate cyclase (GGDEF)-like protein